VRLSRWQWGKLPAIGLYGRVAASPGGFYDVVDRRLDTATGEVQGNEGFGTEPLPFADASVGVFFGEGGNGRDGRIYVDYTIPVATAFGVLSVGPSVGVTIADISTDFRVTELRIGIGASAGVPTPRAVSSAITKAGSAASSIADDVVRAAVHTR